MNILALHSSSGLYGSSRVFLEAIRTLQDNGHNIIAVLSEDGPLSIEIRKSNIEVRIIRLGVIRRKYFTLTGIPNRLFYVFKAHSKLTKLICEFKADLVYSSTTAVLTGAFAARTTKVRHIWHIHEIIEKPAFLHRFLTWMIQNYNDKVIAVSQSVKTHWTTNKNSSKLAVVYNGFDYTAFLNTTSSLRNELRIPDDHIIIGTIGRISTWKGQDYFLRIAGRLHQKNKKVAFVIVGDPYPGNEYLWDSLHNIIIEENISEKVHLLGFREDIPGILQGFDIFMLPSLLPDPLPTVVLEAMAAKKPVIATAQGGSFEMITENITGKFIPINDPSAAAEILDNLIKNEKDLQEMGLKGRNKVLEKFSLDNFKTEFLKSIE